MESAGTDLSNDAGPVPIGADHGTVCQGPNRKPKRVRAKRELGMKSGETPRGCRDTPLFGGAARFSPLWAGIRNGQPRLMKTPANENPG